MQGKTICSIGVGGMGQAEIVIPGDQAGTTGGSFCGSYLTIGTVLATQSGTITRKFGISFYLTLPTQTYPNLTLTSQFKKIEQ